MDRYYSINMDIIMLSSSCIKYILYIYTYKKKITEAITIIICIKNNMLPKRGNRKMLKTNNFQIINR